MSRKKCVQRLSLVLLSVHNLKFYKNLKLKEREEEEQRKKKRKEKPSWKLNETFYIGLIDVAEV